MAELGVEIELGLPPASLLSGPLVWAIESTYLNAHQVLGETTYHQGHCKSKII